MAYLWGATPLVLLLLLMSLFSLFPFSSSLHSLVSTLPPPPPLLPSSVCFHPSHLLLIVTLSAVHFCLSPPPFPLLCLQLPILPRSLPAAASCSSVFHLLPSFQSLLLSHLHPLSLHFIPASVHLFSPCPLFNTCLHLISMPSSPSFCCHFCSLPLFLPSPHFFVNWLHFRLLLSICSSLTFLMDLGETLAKWSTSQNQCGRPVRFTLHIQVKYQIKYLGLASLFIHPCLPSSCHHLSVTRACPVTSC